MKPSDISKALEPLICVQQPTFIWGAPGVGKSNIVAQAASRKSLDLIDLRAILLDPIDLRGLPVIDGRDTIWTRPDFLPSQGKGILFLDELNAAPQAVQAACFQLVLDRKIGNYTLPDGWSILAAGNRTSDRAAATRMPSALANRFVHLDLEPDLNDWSKWALSEGITPEIVAFLRFRPEFLHKFDPAERAFPSPRSWSFVSKILAQCDLPSGQSLETDLIAGTVGEAAAIEFTGFLKVFRSLPPIDTIFMDPDQAIVPDEPSARFAVSAALSRRLTADNLDTVTAYLERLPDEFHVFTVKDALHRDPVLQHSVAWTRWVSEHAALFA